MSTECWVWNGTRNKHGYGVKQTRIERGRWRTRLTHRLAYEWANGPIPKGMSICHHCDNPPCCNPAHLFIGTHKDNVHDAIRKGRANFAHLINNPNRYIPPRQKVCARGHEFTPENTIVKPIGRSCRACANEAQRRRRARK